VAVTRETGHEGKVPDLRAEGESMRKHGELEATMKALGEAKKSSGA
jgi:hypothetical protein